MGTMAVVGYLHGADPGALSHRLRRRLPLMLLAQPAMFAGAIWLNVVGVIARGGDRARSLRGRSQREAAPDPRGAARHAMDWRADR